MTAKRGVRHAASKAQAPAEIFQQAFDEHGYGFHYAILQRFQEVAHHIGQPWEVDAAEFPVEVDKDTRVDFIARHGSRVLLVAECKRPNPAYSMWCFARAPFVSSYPGFGSYTFFDHFQRHSASSTDFPRVGAGTDIRTVPHPVYGVAVEARTGRPGGTVTTTKGAIDDALGQVFRGVNGIATRLSHHSSVLDPQGFKFVPVIFTTATLLVSDVKLDRASLKDGKMDWQSWQVTEVPWLAFNYPVAPGLRADVTRYLEPKTIGEILAQEFVRTVYFVRPEGLEGFLKALW